MCLRLVISRLQMGEHRRVIAIPGACIAVEIAWPEHMQAARVAAHGDDDGDGLGCESFLPSFPCILFIVADPLIEQAS